MDDAGLILNIEGFADFKAGMDALKKLAKDFDSVFVRASKAINTFVDSLNPAPLKAFNDLLDSFNPARAGQAIREFADDLSALRTAVEKTGKSGDILTKFGAGLLAFASGLRQIAELGKGSTGPIIEFTISLKQLFDLVEKRGKALTQLNKNILSFDASQGSLKKISDNLSNLVPNASEVKLSFFAKIQQAVAGLQNGAGPIKQLVGGLKELQGVTINGFFGRGAGDKLIQIGEVLIKVKDNFSAFAKSLEPGRLAFRNVLDLVSAFKQLEGIDIGGAGTKGFTRFNFFGKESTGLISQFERLGKALLTFKDQLGAFGTAVSPGAAALRAFQPFVNSLKSLNEIKVGGSFLGISTGLVGQITRLGNALGSSAEKFKVFGTAVGPVTQKLPLFVQQLEKFGAAAGPATRSLPALVQQLKNLASVDIKASAGQGLKSFASSIKEAFSKNSFLDIGRNLFDGIDNQFTKITTVAENAAKGFIKKFKDVLGIHSPSTVMAAIAQDVMAGLRGGLTGLLQLGTNVASGFVTGFKNAVLGLPGLVKNAFDQVGSTIRQASENLRTSGQNLIQTGIQQVVSGGVAGFIQGQIMTQVGDFDAVTNQIRIFGDLAQEELGSVREELLTFSADTIFDPQQSANAFLGLQKAGLSLQESLSALPNIGNLATAGEIGLEQATQGVIQAAQTFNISISESARIADAYTQAANASTASVSELQQGIANVGPIAKDFGLTFEDTLAILAQFRGAGIQGAEAGTQLKSLLLGITRPTDDVKAAFASLNVSLTDAQGNFKPFNQLLNELTHAMNDTQTVTVRVNNLTAEQSNRLKLAQDAYASATRNIALYNDGLSTSAVNGESSQKQLERYNQVLANAQGVIAEITGSQADAETITKEITRTQSENFRTVQALAGSFGGTGLSVLLAQGDDAISGFVEEMGTLPTAAEIAAETMNTFKGRVESLRGSLQTLAIRALSPLQQKVLTPLIDKVIDIVNVIGKLPPGVLAAAGGIVLFTTAMVTLSGILSIAGGAILTLLGTALAPLSFAFSTITALLFNPIGILTGLAGIASSVLIVLPVIVAFGAAALVAFNIVKTAISDIQNNVGGAGDSFNALKDSVGGLFQAVGDVIGIVISLISQIGGEVSAADAAARGSGLAAFFDGIREKIDAIKNALIDARDFLVTFGAALGIEVAAPEVDNSSLERRNELLAQIQEAQQGINATSATGETITVKAGDTLSQLAQQYDTTVEALTKLNNLENPNLILAGQDLVITPSVEIDETSLANLRNELRELDAGDQFVTPVQTEIEKLQTAVDKFSETPLFSRIFGDPNDANKQEALNAFTNAAEAIDKIRENSGHAKDAIAKIFGGDIKGGIQELQTAIQGIGSGLLDAISAFGNPVDIEGVGLLAPDSLPIEDLASSPFQRFADNLVQGIRDAIDSVRNFSFTDSISGIFTSIKDSITNFDLSGFAAGVREKFGEVSQVIDDVLGGLFGSGSTPGAGLLAPAGIPVPETQGIFSGFADRLVTDVQNTISNISFPDLQTAFEDKFNTVLSILGIAAAFVFPPAGVAIGAVKLLGGAIEADFLGIGTFINESGIRTAVEDAFTRIRDLVSGIFSQETSTPAGAALSAEGLVNFQPAPAEQSPIVKTITDLVNGVRKAIDLFSPELKESLTDIQIGLKGFFENLSGTDTSGIDNLIAVILKIGGAILGIGGAVLLTGIDIVTDIFKNVLPSIGTAISGIVSAISAVGNGDPQGVIDGLGTAIGGLVNAVKGITVSVADGLLDFIERITGVQLPDVAGTFDIWRTNLENAFFLVRVVFDNIKRGLERAFLDIKIAIFTPIDDILSKIEELAATTGIDLSAIGIDFSGFSANITADIQSRDELNFADAIAAEANRQLASGEPIQLDAPFSFDGEALNVNNVDFASQVTRALEQGQLSVAGQASIKNFINTAIQEAITSGSSEDVSTLLPLADFFDIDTTGLVTATNEALTTATENGEAAAVTLPIEIGPDAVQKAIDEFNTQLATLGTENIDPANAQFAIDQILGLGGTPEEILAQVDTEALKTLGVTVGDHVIEGFSESLADPEGKASTAITDTVTAAQTTAETLLESQSPSQWAFRLGNSVIEGLVLAFTEDTTLNATITTVINRFEIDLQTGVQRAMTNITTSITTAQSKINTALVKIGEKVDELAGKLAAFKQSVTDVGQAAGTIPDTQPVQGNWRGGIHHPGVGWIGERGPELVFSNSSMAVLNNRTSQAFATGMQWAMAEYGGARAIEGDVRRGNFYRVFDSEDPEILQSRNGRTYLLPSENGRVNRLSDFRGGSNVSNVDNSRHYSIVLEGGGEVSDEEIARLKQAVREAEEEANRNNNFERRAKLRGIK